MRRRYKTNDPKTKLELDDRNLMKRKKKVQTLSRKKMHNSTMQVYFQKHINLKCNNSYTNDYNNTKDHSSRDKYKVTCMICYLLFVFCAKKNLAKFSALTNTPTSRVPFSCAWATVSA